MNYTARNLDVIRNAALAISFTDPANSVESFVRSSLGVSPQVAALLAGDPKSSNHAQLVSELSALAQRERFEKQNISKFCVYEDSAGTSYVCGLSTKLRLDDLKFSERIKNHDAIKNTLINLKDGHDLEAIGAAIFDRAFGLGRATQGSADEGIDAIGKLAIGTFLPHHELARYGSAAPDEKVVFLASSKALRPGTRTTILSPAAIRELVGAAMIQRTTSSSWQSQGIRMLTPVQLILLTTYRLSEKSWRLCRELNLAV